MHTKPKLKDSFFNLLFNLIIPVLILSKLSDPERLGPIWGLLLALAFPIFFGSYELIKNKKWNFISILGLVSILLTGGLALLKLDGFWFAVKEASIPLVIGFAVLGSLKTKYSIVPMFFFNPQVVNIEKLKHLIENPKHKQSYQKLILQVTYLIATSFFLSASLNFGLAQVLLKSPTGSPEFNQELARMTALSYPVIMLPCMLVLIISLWYLFRGIRIITGVSFQELLKVE